MSERIRGDNNPMRKVEWTAERKERMRQVRAKRGPVTAEQIEKTASKNRGKKRTPEQKERIAAALRAYHAAKKL